MENSGSAFPTRAQLWQGIVLATIAEALWAAAKVEVQEQWWDGPTYIRDNGQGDNGAVTFSDEGVVAVFFDHECPRNPLPREWEHDYDWHLFFRGAPPELLRLAEQALPHMLFPYRGLRVPMITAAFWGFGDRLTAAEPWRAVFDNGARLLRIHLLEWRRAILEWAEYYELSPRAQGLLRSLFERRVAQEQDVVTCEPWEHEILNEKGDEGIDRSRQLLAAIGIVLP